MTELYPKEMALHKKLRRLAIEAGENPLTIGEGLNRLAVGNNAYAILLLLLSLLGALPIPTFGIKPLVGVVVILIGSQIIVGKQTMWLPHWFTSIKMRPDWSMKVTHLGERFLPKMERFIKPRVNWMKYHIGAFFLGITVICLGLVFILSLIPGAKILAGIILLVLSLGQIKGDGVFTLLAVLATLLLVALHAEIIYLLVVWLG
jgi:hypothetical protein